MAAQQPQLHTDLLQSCPPVRRSRPAPAPPPAAAGSQSGAPCPEGGGCRADAVGNRHVQAAHANSMVYPTGVPT